MTNDPVIVEFIKPFLSGTRLNLSSPLLKHVVVAPPPQSVQITMHKVINSVDTGVGLLQRDPA